MHICGIRGRIVNDVQSIEMSKYYASSISAFHMNIRKCSKHRGVLLAYLKSLGNDFDVIVLGGIGSDASPYFSSILSEYICMYELPNGNNYGGVAIYVNHDLKVSDRDDLKKATKTCKCSKCNFESAWIDVIKHYETFTIGGVYRQPGGYTAHSNTSTLSQLNKNDSCIMTGDVNINLLNIDGTITTDLISSVMSHGCVPYIARPTRIMNIQLLLLTTYL